MILFIHYLLKVVFTPPVRAHSTGKLYGMPFIINGRPLPSGKINKTKPVNLIGKKEGRENKIIVWGSYLKRENMREKKDRIEIY